jgi:hypothetical protein
MDDSAPWAVVGMAHGTKISLPISVLIFTAIKPFLDVCFFFWRFFLSKTVSIMVLETAL